MALVHRNAALGEAPVGQLSFVREAYVSLRPGAQPRRNRLIPIEAGVQGLWPSTQRPPSKMGREKQGG